MQSLLPGQGPLIKCKFFSTSFRAELCKGCEQCCGAGAELFKLEPIFDFLQFLYKASEADDEHIVEPVGFQSLKKHSATLVVNTECEYK